MRKIAGSLCLVIALSACGGSGGSNSNLSTSVLPNSATTIDGVATKVAPEDTPSGAPAITIYEHRLGSTPSNGGIAIERDGSVWTESNGTTNRATFVRWKRGIVTAYPINFDNGFSPFVSSAIVASTATHVYAVGFQDQGFGNSQQTTFEIPATGGATAAAPNSGIFSGGGSNGSIVALATATNGSVWEAQSWFQLGCCSGQGILVEDGPGSTRIQMPLTDTGTAFVYDLPTAITQGPDGNLWVTSQKWQNVDNQTIDVIGYEILAYSMAGKLLHTYKIKTTANGIVTGPDHALWFTLQCGEIGRITTSGATTYHASRTTTALGGIIAGSDGALWFLEPGVNRLGRITTSGSTTDYRIPTLNAGLNGIIGPASGTNVNTLWFAEGTSGKIAYVYY